MRTTAKIITSASTVATLIGALALAPQLASAEEKGAVAGEAAVIEAGKKIAFDRKKGNCLACHLIEGGEMSGNIGPPLVGMQARFPDKGKMRAQIWDSTKNNVNTMMPPFGPHEILSESEIDKVVEFIYSL
jgi:sulfur-oxidizing protein SoxX